MEDYSQENQAGASLASISQPAEGQLVVDVFQDTEAVVIQSIIAGVTTADLDISVTKDTVSIRGHRENPEKVRESAYDHQELYWGPFSRSIILPVDIDPDRAKANMKNGILTIRMPKIEKSGVKKIRVQ
ncbi:MAG: heat-shock protein Hsp20 [Candidatus Yanofskybacteria bacterium CG10_big_fil_rev_8_21_14_0_10_46_23]|uniref:Heat-shock protein Hsp20 n=1 Tax=Candidatus Yanofskybacteria bacterium CG10_big_fil_rev_8_21_14_0_10_46_23 TaxID=1975098 RepID=A0A2H0R4W7_9BACT|nr:MAG: heat-shock protein Hsp20 [Candidatus Yanofskybacteria bacterium CG10_big_fil_rev_8_21_14_0_10_46_23]